MKADYHEIIESIKAKSARLYSAYQQQKKLNNELTNQNNTLKQENSELNSRILSLYDELETLKLTSSFNKNGEVRKEAEDQIDILIREIDFCISQINRM
jgi:FtsZ-binding cell division protein ZapB